MHDTKHQWNESTTNLYGGRFLTWIMEEIYAHMHQFNVAMHGELNSEAISLLALWNYPHVGSSCSLLFATFVLHHHDPSMPLGILLGCTIC
jgi:hypothetical protein